MILDDKIFERNLKMFPVYFGERYYIGDIQLREQYELDHPKTEYKIKFKNESANTGLCNDMCSYWMGDQEELTVKTRSTGPKTRLASDTSDDGNGTGDREDADPVPQDAQIEFADIAGQAVGPLNIIAAAVPHEWSVACQEMCTACNRWYQIDGSCAECSSDFDVILDESLYESEDDGSSYSDSLSDDSIVSRPKRKRATEKYNVKNEKYKNETKFKRNKK